MLFNLDPAQFLELLGKYNIALWPLQIAAYLLGFVAVIGVINKSRFSNYLVAAIQALFWLWTGIVFCLLYWCKIFPVARVFGILMLVQGALFVIALGRQSLHYTLRSGVRSIPGMLVLLYALLGYPLLGLLIGHRYPQFFSLGLVPCPTATFSLGLLLLTDPKPPKYLIVIPILLGFSGIVPISIGIYEDIGLLTAGILALIFLIPKSKRG
jgi:hypothetical protein